MPGHSWGHAPASRLRRPASSCLVVAPSAYATSSHGTFLVGRRTMLKLERDGQQRAMAREIIGK
jgi:hypothetical protein